MFSEEEIKKVELIQVFGPLPAQGPGATALTAARPLLVFPLPPEPPCQAWLQPPWMSTTGRGMSPWESLMGHF